MPVTIGEVQVETPAENAQAAGAPPASPAGARAPRPDPEDIRILLRRDEDRAQRLWVD